MPAKLFLLLEMENEILNKVTESGIVVIDPADYVCKEHIEIFDLADFLFMKLILKEKDFRERLKNIDWSTYAHKNVTILCSIEAIIPAWAYMLVASYLAPVASRVSCGTVEELQQQISLNNVLHIDASVHTGKRIILKGCGDISIPEYMYTELTKVFLPTAKSIMYGEPCSTVPIFKRKE